MSGSTKRDQRRRLVDGFALVLCTAAFALVLCVPVFALVLLLVLSGCDAQ